MKYELAIAAVAVRYHLWYQRYEKHLFDRSMLRADDQQSGQTPKEMPDTYNNHRSEAIIERIAADSSEIAFS